MKHLTFILSASARRTATPELHALTEAVVNSPAFLRRVQARAMREIDRQLAGKRPSKNMPDLRLDAAKDGRK